MVTRRTALGRVTGGLSRRTRSRLALAGLYLGGLAWLIPSILTLPIASDLVIRPSAAELGIGSTYDSLSEDVFTLSYPARIRKGETEVVALTPNGPATNVPDLQLLTAKAWGSAISADPNDFRPIHISVDGLDGIPGWRWTIRATEAGKDFLNIALAYGELADSTLTLGAEEQSPGALTRTFILPDSLRPALIPITITNESGLTPPVEFWMRTAGVVIAAVLTFPFLANWWEKKEKKPEVPQGGGVSGTGTQPAGGGHGSVSSPQRKAKEQPKKGRGQSRK